MDYSLANYRLIIDRALRSGYTFASFSVEDGPQKGSIYLRHDVDYSPELALTMARVNAELSVAGTFFFLLRSHAYNLMSRSSLEYAREIQRAGQHLAMHVVIENAVPDEIETRLKNDFQFLEHELPFLAPVFSWHNPTPELIEATRSHDKIAGLINAYSARFTRDVTYRSDSNMRQSPAELFNLVATHQNSPLQLLFHPLIWVIGGHSMGEVLAGAWQHIIKEQQREMSENRIYRDVLPDGIPASALNAFTQLVVAAMKK